MKIPFVFGVTGHRDIAPADLPGLEDRIATLLGKQKRLFPATPLVMLSSLAVGGDRIVANAALREGIEVVPILPMPAEEYEKDFTAPGTLQEFRDLLKRCSTPIVLGQTKDTERDTLYERAGLYIAVHCSLLIALWDGHDSDADGHPMKVGGTAAIVHFRRENALQEGRPLPAFCGRDASSVLDAPGLGPLLHIPVRRASDSRVPNAMPIVDIGSSLDALKTHLDVYNNDVDRLSTLLAREIARSAADLLPDIDVPKHPDLADLRQRFATADILAVAFRNRVQRILPAMAVVGLAVVTAFELFAHIWENGYALSAYLAVLIVPWLIYLWLIKPRNSQGKYLDYRALAEALRVQFFWRLSGVPLNAADFYLRRQTRGLTWIRQAARGCNVGPPADPASADLALVEMHWLTAQEDFFKKTAVREERTFGLWNLGLTTAYIAGIAIAAVLLAAPFVGSKLDEEHMRWVIVAMGFAPAVAASIGFFLERRAYESHIRQYEMMTHLYGVAGRALAKAGSDSDKRAIVEAIGREALAENGDWYFTHQVRKVAPPRGG